MLDAMTHWTRLFPLFARKLSFEVSQIAQKYSQLPLIVHCSGLNTPFFMQRGNYAGCQEHNVGHLSTPGSPKIFGCFEHVSVSRKQRIGGSNRKFQVPLYCFF